MPTHKERLQSPENHANAELTEIDLPGSGLPDLLRSQR
jgi:hypothetical protein